MAENGLRKLRLAQIGSGNPDWLRVVQEAEISSRKPRSARMTLRKPELATGGSDTSRFAYDG